MNVTAPPSPATTAGYAAGCSGAWELLTTGDEVAIVGGDPGAYEIIHLSNGSAWIAGLTDGSQRLVEAASLRLVRACPNVARIAC